MRTIRFLSPAATLWLLLLMPGAQTIMNAQEIRDIRVVNGITVDLTPVHQWSAGLKKGERPMKHWKDVQIVELRGDVGGYRQCVAKIDGGLNANILLANIPPEPQRFFDSIGRQTGAIAAMRAQVAADEKAIGVSGDRYLYTSSEYVSVTQGSVGGTRVDSEETRRAAYRAALQKKSDDEATLHRLEKEYHSLLNAGKRQTTVLAMSSGKKYAGMDIWDCGRKK